MTAANFIIKPPATALGENCGLKWTLNGHVGFFHSPSNVDLCSGQWVLIANQCKGRCCEHWEVFFYLFFYPRLSSACELWTLMEGSTNLHDYKRYFFPSIQAIKRFLIQCELRAVICHYIKALKHPWSLKSTPLCHNYTDTIGNIFQRQCCFKSR